MLKDCFSFLNDVVNASAGSEDLLPTLIAVIKLHSPSTDDQPHIPQTYQLLRTLLLKNPTQLFNSLLTDVMRMVKAQLASSPNREIRSICKSILSLYLQPPAILQPAIESFNRQNHQRKTISYAQIIKEELTFHLDNLQSEAEAHII